LGRSVGTLTTLSLTHSRTPHVLIGSAAVASCAIPGVFNPVELFAKDPNGALVPHSHEGVKYADGSFGNDLPMLRLKELFNVNLFIVSQVPSCCESDE
jgi:TAG lipase/steryl ester hydrolase/phospholipase A2/LPA acyltransferase